MNARIQELAEQCRTEYRDGNGGYIEQFDEEKFAELIVRKCADICKRMGDQLAEDRPNKDFDEIAWYCQDAILDHFGVAE